MKIAAAIDWLKINTAVDPYKTLGVSRWAGKDEIKSTYRKLVMVHHPDRGGDISVIVRINDAYHYICKKRGI